MTSSDVKEDFGKKIKYVLDGGESLIGLESTIIDLRKKPKILRLGGLDLISIQKVLKKKLVINVNPKNISTPGQMKLHYSPGIPIRLNAKKLKTKKLIYFLEKKAKLNQIIFFIKKRKFKRSGKKFI